MTAALWVIAVALVALTVIIALHTLLPGREQPAAEPVKPAEPPLDASGIRPPDDFWPDKLLEATTARGRRYEILVVDWEGEAPSADMRWRWAIMDADRLLRAQLDMQVTIGVTEAYMIGNSPTRAMAESEALAWIERVGGSIVVTR